MNQSTSHQELELKSNLSEASERLSKLERQLHALDVRLSSHLTQQAQYDLLEESYLSLGKLNKLGGGDLYREASGHDLEQQLQRICSFVSGFQKNTVVLEKARKELHVKIQKEQDNVRSMTTQLQARHKQSGQQEYLPNVARQIRDMPYRILPWTTQGSDELRFRKMLVMLLLPAILFGAAVPYFRPPVEKSMGVVVPPRIAKLIKKNQEIKKVEQKRQEQAAKKAAEEAAQEAAQEAEKEIKTPEKPTDAPKIASPQSAETEVAISRRTVETKGVLAFKNDLANLLDDSSSPKMGSEARISVKSRSSSVDSSSSLIVSQASGKRGSGGSEFVLPSSRGSGGISTSNMNRDIGVSGIGQRIAESGIKISRVESTGVESANVSATSEQPLSKGRGQSRTDEEIQVVFDRYKSALYRMYNRELRKNPGLRGKMVLQIVIEPDGSVSECTLQSNDFESTSFASNIVKRVLRFNFGAKAGVPAISILYPIEFLPPS